MQADDQSICSPPHSLSLDHDIPLRPPSLAPSGRYNSFNLHSQPTSNSQERMLLSLPADYQSPESRQSSYKNQSRKVMKRQAANIDESSVSSLPFSYQDSKAINSTLPSTSKDNYSYGSYNRCPLPIMETTIKGKEYPKPDNMQIWEEKKKTANDANRILFPAEIPSNNGVKKRNGKTEPTYSSTGRKHDKNYIKLDTITVIRNEKLPNTFFCDIDLEPEFSVVPNKESSDRSLKMERNLNKTDIIDTSASKIYESMSRCSNNVEVKNSAVYDKSKNDKIVNAYLYNIDYHETEYPHFTGKGTLDRNVKVERKLKKSEKIDPSGSKIYESMLRCSNDDNVNCSIPENSNKSSKNAYKVLGNQYVDMGIPFKDINKQISLNNSKDMLSEKDAKNYVYNTPVQENSNRSHSSRRKSEKMLRRHTTEYRGPPNLVLPPLIHDSSDSAEKSPVAKKDVSNNYPYSILSEPKYPAKKNSITSSTSEENSDAIAAAIKIRMQAKEWRDNKTPKRVDSLTVDRRSSRKNASKSAKIKRRGSLNIIDPATGMNLPLHISQENDMSCSMRNCHTAKSPLMDSRKTPLQISAEDMVQIANCGARNKNGSLCHFISTNNENYLSISQALLDQSSSSEAKLSENKILPTKQHTVERNSSKKSTHSLVLESSDDTLCRDDNVIDFKDNTFSKQFDDESLRIRNKIDSIDRRHKGHTRQRSHDLGKSLKINKQKHDSSLNRKLLQTKSETQRSYKQPSGYYLLENDNGCSTQHRLNDNLVQRKDFVKFPSSSIEALDKPSRNNVMDNNECRCLGVSNHSLAKTDGPNREKTDINNDADPGNLIFRRFGTSSREELQNNEEVEETFDF